MSFSCLACRKIRLKLWSIMTSGPHIPWKLTCTHTVNVAPVFANGVLYVTTRNTLYAIQQTTPDE